LRTFEIFLAFAFLHGAIAYASTTSNGYYEYVVKNDDVIIVKHDKKIVAYICRRCGMCFATKKLLKAHSEEEFLHSQELGPE
jgi:hypothetical protein